MHMCSSGSLTTDSSTSRPGVRLRKIVKNTKLKTTILPRQAKPDLVDEKSYQAQPVLFVWSRICFLHVPCWNRRQLYGTVSSLFSRIKIHCSQPSEELVVTVLTVSGPVG